jgi:hypothetical protein
MVRCGLQQDPGRGNFADVFAELVERGQSRGQRDLLFEYNVDEGLKRIGPVPHRRVAV